MDSGCCAPPEGNGGQSLQAAKFDSRCQVDSDRCLCLRQQDSSRKPEVESRHACGPGRKLRSCIQGRSGSLLAYNATRPIIGFDTFPSDSVRLGCNNGTGISGGSIQSAFRICGRNILPCAGWDPIGWGIPISFRAGTRKRIWPHRFTQDRVNSDLGEAETPGYGIANLPFQLIRFVQARESTNPGGTFS